MDLLTVVIIVFFGGGGLLCAALASYALFLWLVLIGSIMWLLGMSVYNIAAFWALCFGIPLFWKFVHDKEEKELKEQNNSQSNLT